MVRKAEARGKPVRVSEARERYLVAGEREEIHGNTRLSSKNQITLPAEMVRLLGWKSGDDIDLMVWEDTIVIEKGYRGKALLDRLQGSSKSIPEWSTKEAIDAYVRRERDSWDRG